MLCRTDSLFMSILGKGAVGSAMLYRTRVFLLLASFSRLVPF